MFRILELKSKRLRLDTFKKFIETGEAHLGGSFSMIEILIFLFEKILKKNDKFILSKSHASFPLCLILREKGYKIKLTTHLELDPKNKIHCTTGSLGHGLPIAAGMAFARKVLKKKGNIYVLISDGECQEGTTWETLLIATARCLSNLIILIDYNKIQALSKLEDALPLNNLINKIKAFNCNVIDVKDGHSFKNIDASFKKKFKNEKPTVIIFNTIKGKGIKEFENDPVWHARKLNTNDIKLGLKRLQDS
jgi:transketolase